MIRARLVSLAVAAAVCSWPAVAPAQTQLSGIFSAAGGYTDNVLSAPEDAPPEQAKQADSFAEVRPGLSIAYDGARSAHRLTYTFVASVYMRHDEANSYGNRVDYDSLYLVTPRTDFGLTLTAQQGEQNGFVAPTAGMVAATPAGGVKYVSGAAAQTLEWSMDQRWRFFEALRFETFYPFTPESGIPQPRTYTLENRLGIERETPRDGLGLEMETTYGVTTEQLDEMGVIVVPEQSVVIATPLATWRRSLSQNWESELGVGWFEVFLPDDPSVRVGEPAGLVALRYQTEDGGVALEYTHDAGVNIFLGTTFLADQVLLTGELPLVPEGRLVVEAVAGFMHGREFNAVLGALTSTVDVFTTDAGVIYRPDRQFELSVRYSFYTQQGEALVMDAAVPPNYLRNTVMLELTGSVGGQTPRNRRQIPGRARVGGARRDFIEGDAEENEEGRRRTDGGSTRPGSSGDEEEEEEDDE